MWLRWLRLDKSHVALSKVQWSSATKRSNTLVTAAWLIARSRITLWLTRPAGCPLIYVGYYQLISHDRLRMWICWTLDILLCCSFGSEGNSSPITTSAEVAPEQRWTRSRYSGIPSLSQKKTQHPPPVSYLLLVTCLRHCHMVREED